MKLKTSPVTLGTLALVVAMSGSAFAFAQSPSAQSINISFVEESEEDEAAESARLAQFATITESEAIQTAQSAYQGQGKMAEVELEDEDGTIVYGIKFTESDGNEVDVKVDAKIGRVVKIEDDMTDTEENSDDEEDNEDSLAEEEQERFVSESLASGMTEITMEQARQIAIQYFKDDNYLGSPVVTEAGREIKYGQPTYVFEFNQGPNEFDLIFSSRGEFLGVEH